MTLETPPLSSRLKSMDFRFWRSPRRKTLLLGGVILLILLLVGVNLYKIKNPPAIIVETAKVEQRRIQASVLATGLVRVQQPEVITAVTGGKVKEVLVKVGQEVAPGEVLLQLDDEQLALQVRQAEASLALAKANEQRARGSTEVAQAEENLRQLEAGLEHAKKKLASSETLYQAGAISREELDAARLEVEIKQSQVDLAKKQLPAVKAGSTASLEGYIAQTAQAQAALDLVLYQWEHATVRSSSGGRVLELDLLPGDTVTPNQQLAVVGVLDKLEIEAEVSEIDARRIKVGQAVEISSGATEKAAYQGRVTAVAPQAVKVVKSQGEQTIVPLVIEVDSPSELLPGTNADLNITTGLEESALAVPFESLLDTDDGYQVFVIEDGIARLRQVTIGISDESYVQIVSGVQEGETVILNPPEEVEDGAVVKPQPGTGADK